MTFSEVDTLPELLRNANKDGTSTYVYLTMELHIISLKHDQSLLLFTHVSISHCHCAPKKTIVRNYLLNSDSDLALSVLNYFLSILDLGHVSFSFQFKIQAIQFLSLIDLVHFSSEIFF